MYLAILKVFEAFGLSKIAQFYSLRITSSLVSGLVEIGFINSISKAFNPSVSRYLKIMLIFSPGMFIAAPSYLPSSFAMVFVTLAYTGWFNDWQLTQVVGGLGVGSLLGWPFAAAIGIPFAIKFLLESRFLKLIKVALIFFFSIMVI
jgi:alpha-1,2-mannosyltransferase